MSAQRAPIYVQTHDLARWILERIETWPPERGVTLRGPLSETTCQLVTSVSLALTFPRGRLEHLHVADKSVVRLRMLLRLAGDLALFSPGGLRHAQGQLLAIGRMLGGWKKQLQPSPMQGSSGKEEPAAPKNQGTGSPAPTA